MAIGSTWYGRGLDTKVEDDRIASRSGPTRVWIPAGGKKELVFIDDDPLTIYEHNPKLNGNWRNWMTCLDGASDDVACCEILGKDTKYYVGYFTAVDCSEYIDKKGNKYQFEVKLFAARYKTLKKFKRKKEDRGGLAGCQYLAVREDEKSPNCGDEFEFQRLVDMPRVFEAANYRGKKLKELYAKARSSPEELERLLKVFQLEFDERGVLLDKLVPFNYMELLRPKSPKEIRDMLKGGALEKASVEESESAKTDDVPF